MVICLKSAYKLCIDELGKSDGRFLFEGLTEKTVSDVLTHPDEMTDADFDNALRRIKSGEPVQYVVGETEFMGLDFKVTPDVLIPRQDTELLCEWAIDFLKKRETKKALDICTGSGCIAVSVSKLAKAEMTAIDISEKALEIAKENGILNGVKIEFLKEDAHTFSTLSELDLIVSNPPYIKTEVVETLDRNVKDFEPHLALDGGSDGLDFYQDIVINSLKMLRNGGALAVEIGYDQGASVSEIFKRYFGNVTVLKDFSDNDRVVYGVKNI